MTRHKDEFDTMMEQISKNKDLERGLVQISAADNNRCDPVVHEMATAVLGEIKKAKERRALENCLGCVGLVVIVIFIIYALVFGLPTKHR